MDILPQDFLKLHISASSMSSIFGKTSKSYSSTVMYHGVDYGVESNIYLNSSLVEIRC